MEGEILKVKPELKRQRSENWTEEDKELLKELVKNSVSSIENKNTDTNTNQKKKKAWLELQRDFNTLNSGEVRTVSQLKAQWTKMKIHAKKEVSEFRAQHKKTGGGQAPAGVALSGNDIAAWLPNEFVIDENEFDSDMVCAKELLKELVKNSVSSIENKNTDTNTNQKKKKAWLELQRDFNTLNSGEVRTVSQLKAQWTKMKIHAKKEVSEFRAQHKKTGGGQAPAGVALSGNDIAAWLPNEFVIDENEFDSDMVCAKDHQNLEVTTLLEIECLSEDEEYVLSAKETPSKKQKLSTHKIESAKEHVSEPSKKSVIAAPKLVSNETTKNKNMKTFADENVRKIANVDVKCREELHQFQIEVEKKKQRNLDLEADVAKKKQRNLDLEFEMMQAKLVYYKKKSFE